MVPFVCGRSTTRINIRFVVINTCSFRLKIMFIFKGNWKFAYGICAIYNNLFERIAP